MIDINDLHDRMISRSRNLATPPARLQELAPRLIGALPCTVGDAADRLGATRAEIVDAAEAYEDMIANRGGCLVRRDSRLARWDAANPFFTTRSTS